MGTWSPNNRACKTTWSTLRWLKQFTETFDKAGALKMKDLLFWKDDLDLRKTEARALAVQVDDIFRNLRMAKYERDVTQPKAIKKMVSVLIAGTKTVADLAEENDGLYRFLDE